MIATGIIKRGGFPSRDCMIDFSMKAALPLLLAVPVVSSFSVQQRRDVFIAAGGAVVSFIFPYAKLFLQ